VSLFFCFLHLSPPNFDDALINRRLTRVMSTAL
jgi:hypothetical protein